MTRQGKATSNRASTPNRAPEPSLGPKLTYKLEELESKGSIPLDLELPDSLLSELFLEAKLSVHAEGSGRLEGTLESCDAGALLRGTLTCRVGAECKRCLGPVVQELTAPLTVRFVTRRAPGAADDRNEDTAPRGGSFDGGDADDEPLENRRVELLPVIREHLLLAMPIGAVCGEDCKGLCPTCGQNLNDKACNCLPTLGDPRLARLHGLKDIKFRN